LNISYRNIFDSVNAPDYVQHPCTPVIRTIVTTGPITLSMAFYHKNDPNKDSLLPYGYLNLLEPDKNYFSSGAFCDNLRGISSRTVDYSFSNEMCNDIGHLAEQDFNKSWFSGDTAEKNYHDICNN